MFTEPKWHAQTCPNTPASN